MKDSHIEKEAAEALLDVGVSVPFKELCLPWRKEAIRLRFRMGRPRLGGQIRIARLFAGMNVTHAELEAMTEAERLAWGARSHCEPDCCSDDMQGEVERAATVGRGGMVATLVGG